jgi:N-acetylmuramoyl-L-alanine amidase
MIEPAHLLNTQENCEQRITSLLQTFLGLILLLSSTALFAVQVQGVRVTPASDHTRLIIDLSAPTKHHLMTLDAPERLVIDLPKSKLHSGIKLPSGSGVIARIRSGEQDGRLRLVADLKSNIKAKSFLIKAEGRKKDRLVVDLYHQQKQGEVVAPVKLHPKSVRDLIVAIDAGHGGIDPGSIGKHGTQEKRVVMQIANRLAKHINKSEGMRAFMVRANDKKVQYNERMKRARNKGADLFISIHADSYSDSSVGGSSVYVLSQRGASSAAARWLANKVNSADLAGGVSLNDKDDVLASVLLDLSQNASIAASTTLGKNVLNELAVIGRIRKNSVQYANFAVLKSPDIPSILVETAYISNPDEERKLKDPKHQERIAVALSKGVKRYFKSNPPANSLFAQQRNPAIKPKPIVVASNAAAAKKKSSTAPNVVTASAKTKLKTNTKTVNAVTKTQASTQKQASLIKHTIKRGETLSGVSIRYNVKLQALRSINNLKKDSVRIGQVLRVPVI